MQVFDQQGTLLRIWPTSLIGPATFYVDDSEPNVEAAGRLGFDTVRFTGPEQLRRDLAARGMI